MSSSIVKLSILLSANAAQASSTMQNFVVTAQSSAKKVQEAFNGQTGYVQSSGITKLTDGASSNSLMSRIGGMKTVFAGATAAAAAYALGVGVKVAAANEQARISFDTLLKSSTASEKMMADLQQFAATTPFEFDQVRAGAQQMLAYGIAAKDVLPMLRIVGDAASAAPQGMAEGLERVTRAIGQMKGRGKVGSQEMLQLTEAGINAWEMLAKGIGKTVSETQALVEAGAINSGTGIKAILEGMQQQFGGNMQKQSQTILGQLSNLKDNFKLTMSEIGEDLMNAFNIKGIISGLSDAFSWIRSQWKSLMGREDMADPIQRFQKAQRDAAQEMVKKHNLSGSAEDFIKSDWWKKDIKLANEMEQAIQKNLKALGMMGNTSVKNLEITKNAIAPVVAEFEGLKTKILKEIKETGMDEQAKQVQGLLERGASPKMLEELRKLHALKKDAEDQEKMFTDGARLIEDMRSPLETLNRDLERFHGMLQAGAIDWETYDRAVAKAQETFNNSQSKTPMMDMLKGITEGGAVGGMKTITDELEKAKKYKEEAERMNKSELTGIERAKASIEEINELRKQGLREDIAERKIAGIRSEYLEDLQKQNKTNLPGMALAGSQEAYKAMVASVQPDSAMSEEAKKIDELIKVQRIGYENALTKQNYDNGWKELQKDLAAIRQNTAQQPGVATITGG